MEHDVQDASLERFAAGKASREEAHAITRHLLRGCPICAGRLRKLLQPSAEAPEAAEAPPLGMRNQVRGSRRRARSLSQTQP